MNETKILSTRIPFEHYIDVIRRAQKCKLSVSDYLIFILFEDTEKQASVQSLTAQNKLLEQQLKSAIQEIQQKSVEIERLNNELIKVVPLPKPLQLPKQSPVTKLVTVKEKSTPNAKKKRPTKAKQASTKETITST